jgi:hypothetical protein
MEYLHSYSSLVINNSPVINSSLVINSSPIIFSEVESTTLQRKYANTHHFQK